MAIMNGKKNNYKRKLGLHVIVLKATVLVRERSKINEILIGPYRLINKLTWDVANILEVAYNKC